MDCRRGCIDHRASRERHEVGGYLQALIGSQCDQLSIALPKLPRAEVGMGRGKEKQACSPVREVCRAPSFTIRSSILTKHVGSRRTCGRRSPKKWRFHGGLLKQCTGKLARLKWLSEPTCPSFTLQGSKARPRLVQSQKPEAAPRRLRFRVQQGRPQQSRILILTTTACLE
jgi:hypothetical protein